MTELGEGHKPRILKRVFSALRGFRQKPGEEVKVIHYVADENKKPIAPPTAQGVALDVAHGAHAEKQPPAAEIPENYSRTGKKMPPPAPEGKVDIKA